MGASSCGAEEKIVALGTWMMERTGPCQREHSSGRRSCAHPRASACKDQDEVTGARTAALWALHRGDGAGARAVEAETVAVFRRGNGEDGTGARGASGGTAWAVVDQVFRNSESPPTGTPCLNRQRDRIIQINPIVPNTLEKNATAVVISNSL